MKTESNKLKTTVLVSLDDLQELKDSLQRIEGKISEGKSSINSEEYLTANEIMVFLKCSRATVQRIKNSGAVKFKTISGKLYVKKSDLIKAMETGTIN